MTSLVSLVSRTRESQSCCEATIDLNATESWTDRIWKPYAPRTIDAIASRRAVGPVAGRAREGRPKTRIIPTYRMIGLMPRPITSDSNSSPDAQDQRVHLRLSRTCRNSSSRTWKGGLPKDSNSNLDWRDQLFRLCSSRTGSNSCGTFGRWPCLHPPPP
jgi:hypothetical protein